MTQGRKDRWIALIVLGTVFLIGVFCGRCFAFDCQDGLVFNCDEQQHLQKYYKNNPGSEELFRHGKLSFYFRKDGSMLATPIPDSNTCTAKHPENYGGHE